MRIRDVVLVGIAVLAGSPLFAQDYTKIEIPLNYSYAHAEPIPGRGRSLNGGGGSFVFNFNRYFGIRGDLQGYGTTTATFTNITTVNPLIVSGHVASVTTQGNLFTYMVGPQLRIPTHTFKPFADFLFGGAHTNFYANFDTALGFHPASNDNNAFAMAIGGGFDIRVNKSVSVRPFEMDYFLTHFGSSALGINGFNQNNFRYQAGIVFTVGE